MESIPSFNPLDALNAKRAAACKSLSRLIGHRECRVQSAVAAGWGASLLTNAAFNLQRPVQSRRCGHQVSL